MIALLKYGSGLPSHRLEGLQRYMEMPLPASTQWEIVEETAEWVNPVYRELIRQAAQGQVLHNDDTTRKVLAMMKENREAANKVDKSERSGIFTSEIVSTNAGQKIALFFTGRKHAGENLTAEAGEEVQRRVPSEGMNGRGYRDDIDSGPVERGRIQAAAESDGRTLWGRREMWKECQRPR